MSTVVCHGLHSHLESQVMEYRTLKLKLSSPKLSFTQSFDLALQSRVIVPEDCDSKKLDNSISPNSSKSSLNTSSPTPCEKLIVGPYVHPSPKDTSSWLNEKSLNLCTENLGSETGAEFIENSIFASTACSNTEIKFSVKKVQPTRNHLVREPKKQFPPPLTTLCGPDSVHVKPHRKDGRLILRAVRGNPTARSCFQVDRSNGRLRLSLGVTLVIHSSKHTNNDIKAELVEMNCVPI